MPSGRYALDKTHGYITFTYSHLGFSRPHVGFDRFDTTLELDSTDLTESVIEVSIDATSINSRVAEFDKHLNGEKFFDTGAHPAITFRSTGVTPTSEKTLDIVGDLTIKGVTRPVTLAATINKAANHPMRKVPTIGVSAEATVSRSAFGLDAYVPAVGDEVKIYLEVELPQAR